MTAASPSSAPLLRPAVLLVEDHALVRLGFRALVQAHGAYAGVDLDVLEAGSLAEALALHAAHRPRIDLVLLDLALPDASGLEGLAAFRARFPDARIAVLSGSAQQAQMQGAMALGVVAYLRKTGDLHELAAFLRSWRQGGAPPSLPLAAPPTTGDAQPLGTRQQQVLRHLLQGMSNREIADAMRLGEGTVKNHVTSLLLRFGMRSRSQLISHLRQ